VSEPLQVEVYGLAHCTTCQKALAWLAQRGVTVSHFRDVKQQPLSRAEVAGLARRAGGAERLFSRRALKYRALGLHLQPLQESQLLEWMEREYTFITRPVVVRGEHAVAGFAPLRLQKLLED
jgi:arsenate reductase